VEHDITTATMGAEHDITDVAATAHDTTDVAAVERDSTTTTTEGAATPAAVPEGHTLRPTPYVSVPPNVWAFPRRHRTLPPRLARRQRLGQAQGHADESQGRGRH
jgi:hypothetical protein